VALPRVLLVEDDVSIRRLVEMSLDGMPIELITCEGAAQARERLRESPVRLLITDLMMPGETGLELLQSLERDPALRAGARLVVFSAGISPELERTMAALGVWRFLTKPSSMLVLERCVLDALGLDLADDPAARAVPAADETAAVPVVDVHEQAAIDRHFAGNAPLFHAFRATCLTQFADDLQEGDRAAGARDAQGMRRLAHSLKSVLRTLGHEAEANGAAVLESAAAAGDWTAAAAPWADLRAVLQRLSSDASTGG